MKIISFGDVHMATRNLDLMGEVMSDCDLVILSGDLAHYQENWDNKFAPAFNYNHEQSVASMNKVAALLAANHATLYINHDKAQSDTIPHAPAYLD